MTSGIGIACVDGPRPRRSLLTVAAWEGLLRSGRVGRVAGWLDPRLNIAPIIAISVEGPSEPAARPRGPAHGAAPLARALGAALAGRPREPLWAWPTPSSSPAVGPRGASASAITLVIAAHTGVGVWGAPCQVADGTNACRVRYD